MSGMSFKSVSSKRDGVEKNSIRRGWHQNSIRIQSSQKSRVCHSAFKKKNGADLKVVVSPFFFFKTVVRKMPLLLRHDDYALRLDIFFGETFLMLLPLRCCCRMRPS